MAEAAPPPRFKVGNSKPLPPEYWNRKLLSIPGEKAYWKDDRPLVRITCCPNRELSAVGYELFVVTTVLKESDPVYPMAKQALHRACGLSYAALIDALEEDGFWPVPGQEADWVPSRFAALLLNEGLTGLEVDRVQADWACRRGGRARMEKALQQGVIVSRKDVVEQRQSGSVITTITTKGARLDVRVRPRRRA